LQAGRLHTGVQIAWFTFRQAWTFFDPDAVL
jgi:hypothetical protein